MEITKNDDYKAKLSLMKQFYRSYLKNPKKSTNIFLLGLAFFELYSSCHQLDRNMLRGNIMRSIFLPLRELDDIVDDNLVIPGRDAGISKIEYVEEKIAFIEALENEESVRIIDDIDRSFKYNFDLSKKLGIDLTEETKKILFAIRAEAHRKQYFLESGEYRYLSDEELKKIYLPCDINVLNATFKILDSNGCNDELLQTYCMAIQTRHIIKDSIEDAKLGFCNITIEDMAKYKISDDEIKYLVTLGDDTCKKLQNGDNPGMILTSAFPNSICQLFLDQKEEGLEYVRAYEAGNSRLDLNEPARAITDYMLERTRKYLEKL